MMVIVGILGLIAFLIAVVLAIVWGMFIGVKRTRIRFICVLVSFMVALIMAFAFKNIHTVVMMEHLGPMLANSGLEPLLFLWNSEPLHEVVSVCGGALIAPWVFMIVFVLLSVVSWLVCAVVFFIKSMYSKKIPVFDEYGEVVEEYGYEEAPRARRPFAQTVIYAVAQALLTVFVLLTPLVSTLNYLPDLVDEVAEAGILARESEDANALSANQLLSGMEGLNKTPLVVGYRLMGGNAICNGFARIEVDQQVSSLPVELKAITEFGLDMFRLYGLQIQDYTTNEIKLLREVDKDMNESVFLPVVSGEFIFHVTDAWLDENGPRPFLGMTKPVFDKNTTSMAAEPFDEILNAFHKDAYDVELLRDDFDTVERMMEILINNGVIDSMNENKTNLLVEILNDGPTVEQLAKECDKNPSFYPVKDDIIRIGMRSMGSSLKIPANAEQIYGQFTDDLASKVNSLNNDPNMTPEERKDALTASIRETYKDQSGKELNVTDEVIGLYADVLLEEFEGRQDITADEMNKFFEAYAGVESEDSPVTGVPEGSVPSDGTTAPEGGEPSDSGDAA